MDHPQGTKEELEQMDAWFGEEGLGPGSTEEARLTWLWRSHQHTKSHLHRATRHLEVQRSQHQAEMAEVRKSLEQIRIFTEHKNALAQEIQDENDRLKDQLQRLISLQDAQVSEVAKMLYQQGLTELIHSSCSEQVAYLLVERASLLEISDVAAKPTRDENTADPPGAQKPGPGANTCQSCHKGESRHCQSPWKRLFGLHKASQSKCTSIPIEARPFNSQASSVERQFFRLERDLEEGSRRLAMAHSEIRRLTGELESAHLTQRAYEPEMQAAQEEVEQLRHEVEKLKKYEMAELRKAKEMNDRLDLEIRALRNRVRALDAEKSSLQELVVRLQKEVEDMEAELKEQQKSPNVQVACLQMGVQRLELVLQEQQQTPQTVQIKANQATEFSESWKAELSHSQKTCRDVQTELSAQTRRLLVKESEILSLKQNLDDLKVTNWTKDNTLHDQKLWKRKEAESHQQLQDATTTGDEEQPTKMHKEAGSTQASLQDECKALKDEICEALTCVDSERRKCHEMKQKHKAKLSRAKQKLEEETTWRDEKIKSLERELSLCSHSLAKGKELVARITEENEKLLVERRELLQHLNEEEHSKKESNLTACLSKCRVEFLETENKKLGSRIVRLSDQLGVLERTLQSMQPHHFTEDLKKNFFPHLSLQTSSVTMPVDAWRSDAEQSDLLSSPTSCKAADLPRSAEMGYLNLTSTQNCSSSPASHSASQSTVCVSELFNQSEASCR
ncbi:coiled-coil domain-containing protein 30 isoform X2 [Betta splendens]|uniref:Coiled-coil domain-containing protein 30 isoform X2 n=1 Tax=Betta splendens TaxID=158456 RepID=A0A6P7MP62_BETSP|nr:coiled-coil domain-containing protein 30 isoform X2 [Betta splendens]